MPNLFLCKLAQIGIRQPSLSSVRTGLQLFFVPSILMRVAAEAATHRWLNLCGRVSRPIGIGAAFDSRAGGRVVGQHGGRGSLHAAGRNGLIAVSQLD